MGAEDLPKGTLIDGRYDIRARLGRGGMGTVYRAFDNKVGGMVALKVLREGRPGGGISPEDRQKRFGREILAINQVDHPNVVRIENFGFYKGAPYMVMQLLTGKDLGTVLHENGGSFSVEHAADLIVSICVVIRACHEAQVVHRDLKPENVMIVKRDVGLGWEAKIVDFGIAKLAAIDDLTQEGRIAGTPAYLAPEQIAGKPGPASDQYAIAVLLYLCLTGVHPFTGFSGLPLIRAIEKGVFKDPRETRPELPAEMASIVCKAMHLDPAQRYESVFEFGRALRPFCSGLGQQLWKNYYDTPPIRGNKIDPKASVAGIPLVRQMAEGGTALGAQTLHAHYESTTAVGEATVHDGGAPIAIRDTAVDSKPVTQVVQPSSATAIDVALPPRRPLEPPPVARIADRSQSGKKVERGASNVSTVGLAPAPVHRDESSPSGSPRKKRGMSRVVLPLVVVAALGGGVIWFVERGALGGILGRSRSAVSGRNRL
jgi:serine/threonine-protein kinase